MKRKIIEIDEKKCNGCGACADACHEGAIGMVDGKARLMRDDYCDGLGDCLPVCPTDAIKFVEREAAEYDEQAVMRARQKKIQEKGKTIFAGCPGHQMHQFNREEKEDESVSDQTEASAQSSHETPRSCAVNSQLAQWPCQIKLVPTNAPYFNGAKLLIAADCTAYAYANMHQEFMRGRITLIGCPKLDSMEYSDKLTEIIRNNNIKSVTVVRMEVPCCGGLETASKLALQNSGKFIPWQVVTITLDGKIKED